MDFTNRSTIAKAAIIGVFLLIGTVVASGALLCVDTCPTFSQVHYDRFVDLIMYIGFAGAIYVGLRMSKNNKDIETTKTG